MAKSGFSLQRAAFLSNCNLAIEANVSADGCESFGIVAAIRPTSELYGEALKYAIEILNLRADDTLDVYAWRCAVPRPDSLRQALYQLKLVRMRIPSGTKLYDKLVELAGPLKIGKPVSISARTIRELSLKRLVRHGVCRRG